MGTASQVTVTSGDQAMWIGPAPLEFLARTMTAGGPSLRSTAPAAGHATENRATERQDREVLPWVC